MSRVAGAGERSSPLPVLGVRLAGSGARRRTFGIIGCAQAPDRLIKMEVAISVFPHHAAEVAAGIFDMAGLFRGHEGNGNGGALAAHGHARFVPEGFGDAEIDAQPIGGIDDIRPVGIRILEIFAEARRQAGQLLGADAVNPCLRIAARNLPRGRILSLAALREGSLRLRGRACPNFATFVGCDYSIFFKIRK